MNHLIYCFLIALNLFVSGKDLPEEYRKPAKTESAKTESADLGEDQSNSKAGSDETTGGGGGSGVIEPIVMASGYVCRAPNPSWCPLLERNDRNRRFSQTRDQYQKFVFDLFDTGKYDNRTRPNFSRNPDMVKVRLYIESLGPASENEMSFRLRVKSKCLMFLSYFPFDRQLCELEISSFSYDNQDIIFKWANDPLEFNGNIVMSEFILHQHRFVVRQFKVPSMPNEQTVLVLQYILNRSVALYFGQIFLPSTLIVFVSWITFYINPTVVPARASVGITCVLTIMTLTTSCIGSLPTNLMYTPVDIYMGACFMFVFGALIEFAVVNFSETSYKRRKERNEKLRSRALGVGNFHASGGNSPRGEDRDSLQSQVTALHNQHHHHNTPATEFSSGFVSKNGAVPTIELPLADSVSFEPPEDRSCWANIAADPMAIDYFSRFLYPICFFIFSVIYWTATLTLSSNYNESIIENAAIAARIDN
ncbi:gamma-aminobutyric acid receptor subunit pi-like [Convolutriloba macropyga]|uniref:gamma-aminobutyric acid receptor subunit pi-like n=1 Tax=Convolutriloba macropyga TaxID=536237 RepID=UPI003F51F0A8